MLPAKVSGAIGLVYSFSCQIAVILWNENDP